MLAMIRDDTWNMKRVQHAALQIWKDGLTQTSSVMVLEKSKPYPNHMVEGDYHLRKRPKPHPHIEADTKWPSFCRNIFKCILLNENHLRISLKFVCKVPVNNIGPDNGMTPNRLQTII